MASQNQLKMLFSNNRNNLVALY